MIPADASVLEVGCGEGDLLAALPNRARTGVDYAARGGRARAARATPSITLRGRRRARPRRRHAGGVPPRAWDAIVCDRLCHSVLDVRGAAARRCASG